MKPHAMFGRLFSETTHGPLSHEGKAGALRNASSAKLCALFVLVSVSPSMSIVFVVVSLFSVSVCISFASYTEGFFSFGN